jgi:uncharacterized protein YggE
MIGFRSFPPYNERVGLLTTSCRENNMKYAFFILVLASLTTAGLSAEPELRGSPTDLTGYLAGLPRMVSVTGESEVKLPADRAMATLKISTENKSLQEALRLNQELRGKLIAALKELGLAADQIQAARFASTQKHGVFTEKAKSYRLDSFLKVTVRDEKEFQAVAGTVDRWAELHFLGIEFEHSNKEALKAKAVDQACDNAAERKKAFEDKLGVKLVAKRFSGGIVPPLVPAKQGYGSGYASSLSVVRESASPSPADGNAIEEAGSLFGELIYTARITVEYAVEGK